MLDLEAARQQILDALPPPAVESVPLPDTLGRVSAADLLAPFDLPRFDNSAMDGYAVLAKDVGQARAEAPVILQLAGCVAAGQVFAQTLKPGTCVRLFTGSPLPAGADAVVMQEDTRMETAAPGSVTFLDGAKPWENIRLRGEDVKQGSLVLCAGQRITPGRLGLLAALGVKDVRVGVRPKVALLATGSELVEPGAHDLGDQALAPGKIFESNRLVLAAWLKSSGLRAAVQPLTPDTLEATRNSLQTAFAQADLVVTSGGVSVGEFDFVKQAFAELGGTVALWRISIKPGKPFVFGHWQNKFLFGLPGNPVSAAVTFLLLVRPALWRLQGAMDVLPEMATCQLAERLVNSSDRREFVRVQVDRAGRGHSAGPQASHRLMSLANANGLVEVPPQSSIDAGTVVPVIQFG